MFKVQFLEGFIGSLLFTAVAWSLPAQVALIRHGEKPASGNELNSQGCERAYLLPNYLLHNPVLSEFGLPKALFAQQMATVDNTVRPIQTLIPTAVTLDSPGQPFRIDNRFLRDDVDNVANEILQNPAYDQGTVIVSWEHKVLVQVAQALGANVPAELQNWPSSVFDQTWVIRFSGGQATLQVLPQSLLTTDSPAGPGPSSALQRACQTNASINANLISHLQVPLPAEFHNSGAVAPAGGRGRRQRP